jgi:hypothetical protein
MSTSFFKKISYKMNKIVVQKNHLGKRWQKNGGFVMQPPADWVVCVRRPRTQ